jgi:rhamnosyltransferase
MDNKMDKMITKIDAVVVLYNPDESIIENIQSYQQVNKIYAIDNSEKYDDNLIKKLKQFKNLVYINNNGNKGIANALNVGAKLAIENGVDWLLTMDQDSKFAEDGLKNLQKCLSKLLKNNTNIGLVSPSHKKAISSSIQKELVVMTSGNLMNLKAYLDVEGFEEKLFIDAVDYDFCLKLNLRKYEVLQCNDAILHHQLGESKSFDIFGKKITSFTHSPIRRYYMARNALYLWRKYFFNFPIFILKKIVGFQRNWVEIFLFSTHKSEDIKMMLFGVVDFLKNKYGKLS